MTAQDSSLRSELQREANVPVALGTHAKPFGFAWERSRSGASAISQQGEIKDAELVATKRKLAHAMLGEAHCVAAQDSSLRSE